MSDNIKVEKKDGNLEDFNFDKIILSIGKAMMPIKSAEKVADKVRSWAIKEAKKGVITSEQLRDKVTKELKKQDPVAASSYELYKK